MAGMGSAEAAFDMAGEELRRLVESVGASLKRCDAKFYNQVGPAGWAGWIPIQNPMYNTPQCKDYRNKLATLNAHLAGRASDAAAPGLTMPPAPAGTNPPDNNPDKAELDRATNQKTADWLKNYFDGVYVPPEDETGTGGDPDEKRPGDISMWVWVGIAGIGLLALGNKR
jgi:hypothetical protein